MAGGPTQAYRWPATWAKMGPCCKRLSCPPSPPAWVIRAAFMVAISDASDSRVDPRDSRAETMRDGDGGLGDDDGVWAGGADVGREDVIHVRITL